MLDWLNVRLDGGVVVGLTERVTATREQSSTAAVGQEPVVTDAHEPAREDMEQKPAAELTERQREGAGTATSVVLVTEGDGLVIDME